MAVYCCKFIQERTSAPGTLERRKEPKMGLSLRDSRVTGDVQSPWNPTALLSSSSRPVRSLRALQPFLKDIEDEIRVIADGSRC
jgi:hypothetical protein